MTRNSTKTGRLPEALTRRKTHQKTRFKNPNNPPHDPLEYRTQRESQTRFIYTRPDAQNVRRLGTSESPCHNLFTD